MFENDFVLAADRHGREDDVEGDIYIGAGDEIYAVEAGEDAEGIEEHETGLYGNADSEEEQQRAQQIMMEAQGEAESEDEFRRILEERMREEGIEI